MPGRDRTNKVLFLFLILTCFLGITGCTTARLLPLIQLDTPDHHVYAGMKLLDTGKYADARREFELALQLDKKYSKAYTGIGLVNTYTSDFKNALDNLEKGVLYARTDEEKLFSHVSMIRYQTQSNLEKKWLDISKNEFKAAVEINPKHSAAYYFLGLAFKQACNFDSAGEMFAKVLVLKTDYVSEADREWKFIQKVQRAMPGSAKGKRIALVERITRADAAALFIEELKIDALYEMRRVKTSDASFPYSENTARKESYIRRASKDIVHHPLKADIEGILKIGVRGLENDPDGNFKAGQVLTRAEFALILEDILMKVTGDQTLATRFTGSRSPFSDVQNVLPYFNAAMVVTTRGLMEVKNATTGEFAPGKPVAGVDALLSIRSIKDKWDYN